MKTILPTWLEWPSRGKFFSFYRSSVQIVFSSCKNQLSPCWKHYWNPCVTVCIMYMIQNHGTFNFKNTFGLHSRNNLKIAYVQNGCPEGGCHCAWCSNSIPSGFLIMSHLRKELFLSHSLLQYMLVAGLVSPLEATYWSVELVRSCSLIKLAYQSLGYK